MDWPLGGERVVESREVALDCLSEGVGLLAGWILGAKGSFGVLLFLCIYDTLGTTD